MEVITILDNNLEIISDDKKLVTIDLQPFLTRVEEKDRYPVKYRLHKFAPFNFLIEIEQLLPKSNEYHRTFLHLTLVNGERQEMKVATIVVIPSLTGTGEIVYSHPLLKPGHFVTRATFGIIGHYLKKQDFSILTVKLVGVVGNTGDKLEKLKTEITMLPESYSHSYRTRECDYHKMLGLSSTGANDNAASIHKCKGKYTGKCCNDEPIKLVDNYPIKICVGYPFALHSNNPQWHPTLLEENGQVVAQFVQMKHQVWDQEIYHFEEEKLKKEKGKDKGKILVHRTWFQQISTGEKMMIRDTVVIENVPDRGFDIIKLFGQKLLTRACYSSHDADFADFFLLIFSTKVILKSGLM